MSAVVLEFSAELSAPDALRLRSQYRLQLNRRVAERSFLEFLSPSILAEVKSDFLVEGSSRYDAERKFAPSLDELEFAAGTPADILALLFEISDPEAVKHAVEAAGGENLKIIDDRDSGGSLAIAFQVDDQLRLTPIAEIDEIVWLEADWPVVTHATDNVEAVETLQSGIMGQSPIWDKGLHGEGQIIGVIDKGIPDIGHCFFSDAPNSPGPSHRKIVALFNEASGVIAKHPGSTCGIVAGDERGTSATNVNRGGAYAARLVYSNQEDMPKKSRSLKFLLERAQKKGAFVHSNSWSIKQATIYNKMAGDLDQFCWENEDAIVVFSTGNTWGHFHDPANHPAEFNSPPATAKNTLCVLAARGFPDDMQHGSGMDGPTPDGRRKPEIAAIGGEFKTVKANTPCDVSLSNGFHTSYATPHVAAAAALVRQYFQEGFYHLGRKTAGYELIPSGALIKAVLLNSTVDMTDIRDYPSDQEGWGLIRLDRALYFEGGKRRLVVKDVRRASGLTLDYTSTDKQRTYQFIVNDPGEQLKITLVWNDYRPNDTEFRTPVVNVLGLEAFAQAAPTTVYKGNDIDISTGLTRPNGQASPDEKNNVHMIIVDNPPTGRWTVKIGSKQTKYPGAWSQQGFALAISGGVDQYAFIAGPIV